MERDDGTGMSVPCCPPIVKRATMRTDTVMKSGSMEMTEIHLHTAA